MEVTVGLEPTFAALQAAASSTSASPPNFFALHLLFCPNLQPNCPATPTYPDQVSVDSIQETVTVSCGHKEKTHRPATLAVGRNPLKLNGKLVGQPPRARQSTRATRTAAAYRVHLEIEVHQQQNTRLRLLPASLARNGNQAGVVVQLRLRSDLSSCPISAGE